MELDSLRERIQRIHVETEGREETRLLPPDREEGEGRGVQGGSTLPERCSWDAGTGDPALAAWEQGS